MGLALGITGAGGSILAVPLLLFALDLRPQDAMGISLGAVSAAAIVGVLLRRHQGNLPNWGFAWSLAIAGMCTAPLGRLLADQMDDRLILGLFCMLAIIISVRMWNNNCSQEPSRKTAKTPASVSDSARRSLFLVAGAGLGVLTGLFGVGGGFLIVPFLRLYTHLPMEKAISTSLLIITFVGTSGYLFHLYNSRTPNLQTMFIIGLGSILGILGGTSLSARLSGVRQQKIFSGFVMLVMTYVMVKTFA